MILLVEVGSDRMWIYFAVLQIDNPRVVEEVDYEVNVKSLDDYLFRKLQHLPDLLADGYESLQHDWVGDSGELDAVDSLVRKADGGGEFVGLWEAA